MGRWYRSTAYAISAASGILLALPVHVHADEFVMQVADQDDYKYTQLYSASQTWKIGLYLIPFDLTIVAFAMCKHVGHPKQRLLYKTAVGVAALGHVLSSLLHNSFLWALALRYGILVFIISVHVMLRTSCTFGSAEDQHAKSKSRSVVLKFQRDTRRRPTNSRYSSGKHSQDTKAPTAAPIGKTQMVIQVCPEDDRVGKTMHSRKLVKAVLSKTPAESHEYHATRKLLKESGMLARQSQEGCYPPMWFGQKTASSWGHVMLNRHVHQTRQLLIGQTPQVKPLLKHVHHHALLLIRNSFLC